MAGDLPRITFGMIVLNGQPFIRYNLRALYPFAHEIIVVEGAVPAAAALATPSGHSLDGSLAELRRFQEEEDPAEKVHIVVRDGFWGEKDEMSQAYAQRATGDYLWQVDVDEFYQPQAMQSVRAMLHSDPDITAVSFKQITFWGGFDYLVNGWYLRQGAEIFHRLFKWGPGFSYASHRPPTVSDRHGRNLRDLKYVSGYELAKSGIALYHYSLLFPRQVEEKSRYYGTADWAGRPRAEQWAQDAYRDLRRPYQVHNVYHYPSWLERFEGQHPPQIAAMRHDMELGLIAEEQRPIEDIERLLNNPAYRLGRIGLRMIDPIAKLLIIARRNIRRSWLGKSYL